MPRKKELSFEEALKQLEDIVKTMEEGDENLAVLVDRYAQGVKLSRRCLDALDAAEKAMDILVTDGPEGIRETDLAIEVDGHAK